MPVPLSYSFSYRMFDVGSSLLSLARNRKAVDAQSLTSGCFRWPQVSDRLIGSVYSTVTSASRPSGPSSAAHSHLRRPAAVARTPKRNSESANVIPCRAQSWTLGHLGKGGFGSAAGVAHHKCELRDPLSRIHDIMFPPAHPTFALV